MKTDIDIAFITGDHPRHIYFANKIVENFDNSFIAIQEREPHSLKPGDFYNANTLNSDEKRLWNNFLIIKKQVFCTQYCQFLY